MVAYCRFRVLFVIVIVMGLAGLAAPVQVQAQDDAARINALALKLHQEDIERENFTEWVGGNLGTSSEGVPEGLTIGKAMPDFTFSLFATQGAIKRADMKGPYILNFWASWCPPCQDEFPLMIKGIEQRTLNMPVYFVNVFDRRTDAERYLKDFSSNTITIVTDDAQSTFAKTYGINAIPQTILVDAKGNIQAIHSGDMTDLSIQFFAEIAAHPGVGSFDAANTNQAPGQAPGAAPTERPSGGASFFKFTW